MLLLLREREREREERWHGTSITTLCDLPPLVPPHTVVHKSFFLHSQKPSTHIVTDNTLLDFEYLALSLLLDFESVLVLLLDFESVLVLLLDFE